MLSARLTKEVPVIVGLPLLSSSRNYLFWLQLTGASGLTSKVLFDIIGLQFALTLEPALQACFSFLFNHSVDTGAITDEIHLVGLCYISPECTAEPTFKICLVLWLVSFCKRLLVIF